VPGGRVIVVGSVNVDLVVRTDRLPGPGETVTGGTFERHDGGKGGNQAVAATRLGAPTWLVAAVGDDDHGRDARRALAAAGVGVDHVATVPGRATGVALIVVASDGENQIAVASGANADLEPEAIAAAMAALMPNEGDVVLVSHEIPTSTVRRALALGAAGGAITILDPAPATGLAIADLAAAAIITPDRAELAMLAGGDEDPDPEPPARRLLAAIEAGGRATAVIVTLGPDGALVADRQASGGLRVRHVAAPAVAAIDATGAGDAFAGALAASLASGSGLQEATDRAVVAGSLATTRTGAREALPTRAELEARLARPEDRDPTPRRASIP